jgi:hypothetical protein
MKKTFDCVKMMRDIRTKLSRRYIKHPEVLERDLEEIRRKYGFPHPQRRPTAQMVAEEQAKYKNDKGRGSRRSKSVG